MANFLFYKIPVTFESRFPLDISVQRLENAVRGRWGLLPFFPGVYGKVTESSVRLHRVIPLLHNSWAPEFRGRFEVLEGRVVLRGAYSMSRFTTAFSAVWLAGVSLAEAGFLLESLRSGSFRLPALIPLAMLLFFYLMVKLGKWFSGKDIGYISGKVRESLNPSPDGEDFKTAPP